MDPDMKIFFEIEEFLIKFFAYSYEIDYSEIKKFFIISSKIWNFERKAFFGWYLAYCLLWVQILRTT